MKKHLMLIVQVLVSVVILAYLFHSIFERQAAETLKPIASEPNASPAALATRLKITPAQVELVRTHCVVVVEGEPAINLKNLPLRVRRPLVWKLGPNELWEVFRTINPYWFLAAIACFGMVCLLGIVRWQLILRVQGLDIKFWRATAIFFIGMFFNAFLLGATGGDVIKAWYVAHETHHKKAEAVITVVVDRLIGLLALFLIALIMMAIFWQRVFEDKHLIGFSIFTLTFVIGTVTATVLGFWKGFADRFPLIRASLQKLPKYDMLHRMVGAYREYASHPRVVVQTMLQSFGVHFFVFLSIICIARGLNITAASVVDYFLYLPIINSLAAIPISFSGFGVREGMYVGMFAQVGMPEVQALALSLLGYLAGLFWSLVGSIFYISHRKEVVAIEHEAAE
jgi:glycosyltransferase 2 family protein